MKKAMWIMLAVVTYAAVLTLAGCGGWDIMPSVPPDIHSIAIPTFINNTSEPNLEQDLTQKVIQAFVVDGRLNVTSQDNADSLLQGRIQNYSKLVLLRDQNQVPEEYKLSMTVDIDFTDLKSHKLLWTTRQLVSLTPGTTPTAGQLENYNSTNLASLTESTTFYVLNNVGAPAQDENTVRQNLENQTAQRVVNRTLDGF